MEQLNKLIDGVFGCPECPKPECQVCQQVVCPTCPEPEPCSDPYMIPFFSLTAILVIYVLTKLAFKFYKKALSLKA